MVTPRTQLEEARREAHRLRILSGIKISASPSISVVWLNAMFRRIIRDEVKIVIEKDWYFSSNRECAAEQVVVFPRATKLLKVVDRQSQGNPGQDEYSVQIGV